MRTVFPDMLPAGCHVLSAAHSPEPFNGKRGTFEDFGNDVIFLKFILVKFPM